jgi:ribosomal protein L7/L12
MRFWHMWIRLFAYLLIALVLSGVLFALIAMLRAYMQPKSKQKQAELPMDAGLRDLIQEGRLAEATELYRRFTGIDEIAAQNYVRNMAREIRLSDESYQAVKRLLKTEGKAAAIEAYQSQTGLSLAEALDYVESVERGEK